MSSLTHILLLIGVIVGCGALLWRVTDQDPKRFRVNLARQEVQASKERESWAANELKLLAQAAGLKKVPSFGVANSGAHYSPLRHRICVSRAYLSRLSNEDLRLILAHEVGHAARRWRTLLCAGAVGEEIMADRIAVQITGYTPSQWANAVQASMLVEPGQDVSPQLAERASVLGVNFA